LASTPALSAEAELIEPASSEQSAPWPLKPALGNLKQLDSVKIEKT